MLSLTHPIAFLIALAIFISLAIWLIPKIWRGIKVVFGKLMRLFGVKTADRPEQPSADKDALFDPRLLRDKNADGPRRIE